MRVQETLDDGLAICVDEQQNQSEVMTGLVGGVAIGDLLLVHAGTALLRITDWDGRLNEVRR